MTDQTHDDARQILDAAPYDAGDAPGLSRPLPVHDDLQRARAGRPTPHLDAVKAELAQARATIDALTAERDDARAALRTAAGSADRFRDVLADALGHHDNNPGDDTLIAELRAHFGRTGPEPTRWRDALTGYRASVDQINADQAALGSPPARAQDRHDWYPDHDGRCVTCHLPNGECASSPPARAQDDVPEPLRTALITWRVSWRGTPTQPADTALAAAVTGRTDATALGSPPARAQDQVDVTDPLAAALDAWAQHWHHRRQHGATPAQPADAALLAAYDAHRHDTADRLDQANQEG